MTRVFRILRRRYAENALDGEGAYRFGGRWSSVGTRMAYAAEHVSLAMLEYFVHVELGDAPRDLVLISADIPDNVSRTVLWDKELPPDWRVTPAPTGVAVIGDSFVKRGAAAILVVPSALAPVESNWLINPAHRDFRRIHVNHAEAFDYDQRFFRIQ